MAIASVDRDPARQSSASEPRFKLLEELCRAGDAAFWRAQDRRNGRPCVLRVFDGSREDGSRRLGELHRERTLAERLGLPGMLRTDVPLIEDGRIHQLVDPEPVRLLEPQEAGGRLAMLTLLVSVAKTLADVHARGAFHGAFGRASCLRTADGRVVVQGFIGDAPAAATVRDGIVDDHRAFLLFAQEALQPTGGPPPRLRRYFTRQLEPGAPRVAANALATLADELRESLEDTFPWPAAAAPVMAPAGVAAGAAAVTAVPKPPTPARTAQVAVPTPAAPVAPVQVAPVPLPVAAVPSTPATAAKQPSSRPGDRDPTAVEAPRVAASPMPGAAPAADLRTSVAAAVSTAISPAGPGRKGSRTGSSATPQRLDGAPSFGAAPTPAMAAAPAADAPDATLRRDAPAGIRAEAAVDAWYPPAVPELVADTDSEVTRPRRSMRPWIGAILVLGAAFALWHFGGKGGDRGAPAAAPPPASRPAPATPAPTGPDAAGGDRPAAAAPADVANEPAVAPKRRLAAESSRSATERSPRAAPAPQPAAATRVAARPAPQAEAAQATRSRVATLVAGGNRALNALEPGMAGEAFAAALALSPNDRAAIEGSQRARRLAGVAALMRDAREASARGDHARAVQGYSQALSNDPRNRGLAEALASARRNLARDGTGQLLADGHAALGAGRLEAARAAFERALAADPGAPGARLGIEQATTAIALRDQAAARRVAALDPGS